MNNLYVGQNLLKLDRNQFVIAQSITSNVLDIHCSSTEN